ncbi:MAG: lipopolysaccharide assembly protein LapA domain-containing protein [Tissierellia bacterium]|nr:lipopolysaccharide assembly protein LapA domain-containing protein [Tissierellia bacterium]MDD4779240.1 lipopolysaccharide assembly protein LapA domain-containing protein [Tissierellia bacterium]
MQLGFIFVLIVSIFIAIFAIQNGGLVTVDLFLASYQTPLAVVIMVCIILGAIIILALGSFRQFKKISETKELKNKIKVFDSEKAQLETTIKSLEAEIQNLKENNISLTNQISDLQSKNGEIESINAKLNEEIKASITTNETELAEGAGLNVNNEEFETQN